MPIPNDTDSFRNDAKYILTVLDDHSRFLVKKALPSCKRVSIIDDCRDRWIAEFCLVDNEQFKGTFVTFCKQDKVDNLYTAPYRRE